MSIGILLMHVGLFVAIPLCVVLLPILLFVYYRRWSAYKAGLCVEDGAPARGERGARHDQ